MGCDEFPDRIAEIRWAVMEAPDPAPGYGESKLTRYAREREVGAAITAEVTVHGFVAQGYERRILYTHVGGNCPVEELQW